MFYEAPMIHIQPLKRLIGREKKIYVPKYFSLIVCFLVHVFFHILCQQSRQTSPLYISPIRPFQQTIKIHKQVNIKSQANVDQKKISLANEL